jgi:D-glucosaminate-6-phosphate ammonia-lyase
MPNRRGFLSLIPAIPGVSTITARTAMAAKPGALKRDLFKELGVRTFINAAGTYTMLTASLMPKDVVEAYDYGSQYFVHLVELQDAVGARIAKMLKCEAAMVTSGAAGALTVGTAACLTGTDNEKILRLPDLTGMKSEVLVQKSHRYGYDHAVRACGVKMMEIETPEELERASNGKTAMMLFFNNNETVGRIPATEWVRLGKKLNIPTFNDASADALPVENLWKYTGMGFDLVTFSGGKGIRGPQSAGILLGRRDLIAAARLNTSPYSDSIARGMKVNKEEMLAMMVALEVYISKDFEAEAKEWNRRVEAITKAVKGLPTIKTSVDVPPIANHTPHLSITWDQSRIKITPLEAMKKLREGTPSIEACPATDKDNLVFTVWMLNPGEAEIVAKRTREVLSAA